MMLMVTMTSVNGRDRSASVAAHNPITLSLWWWWQKVTSMVAGGRMRFRGGESGSWWGRRTGCEKKLIVAFGLATAVAIALVISTAVVDNKNSDLEKKIKQLEDQLSSSVGPNPSSTVAPANATTTSPLPPQVCLTPECLRLAATVSEAMNTSVDPCEDFFQFACGSWVANHPIPDDQGRFSNFDVLAQTVLKRYIELLETIVADNDTEPTRKAKHMYQACMEKETVWRLTKPAVMDILQSEFGGWPIAMNQDDWKNETNFDWMRVEVFFMRHRPTPTALLSSLVDISVQFDAKNTSRNVINLDQPSLGVTRDFHAHPQNYSEQLDAYRSFITQVAKYFGGSSPIPDANVTAQVADMMTLEGRLANISLPVESRRDKEKLYNNMTLAEVRKNVNPFFDWTRLMQLAFEGMPNTTIDENETVVVVDMEYMANLTHVFNTTAIRTIANYMAWRFLIPLLPDISKETEAFRNEFVMNTTGTKKPQSRDKVCANAVDAGLGFILGEMYVRKYFNVSSKIETTSMIGGIKNSFMEMLTEVSWFDNITRDVAVDKAANMSTENIGYPDWILNVTTLNDYYKTVSINATDHRANLNSAAELIARIDLSSLREYPADRTKWYMSPGTVNAYYVSELNSINFPAGILQPPFFEEGRLKALNFGGIGSVIGHEITHGFDDQGRQYDKEGNLEEWWSTSVIGNFTKEAECYVDQYDSYCPEELTSGKCLNGKNTLGENIADNGGIKAAFKAYRSWVAKNGEEQRLPSLEKYSPEELFFIGFGQLWCASIRNSTLLNKILTDPHSPPKYRIIGTVSNSPDFAQSFGCPKDSEMNPTHKCQLW